MGLDCSLYHPIFSEGIHFSLAIYPLGNVFLINWVMAPLMPTGTGYTNPPVSTAAHFFRSRTSPARSGTDAQLPSQTRESPLLGTPARCDKSTHQLSSSLHLHAPQNDEANGAECKHSVL